MLLSLSVYSLTALVLFMLGWHVNKREQQLRLTSPRATLPFWSWEILLSILFFAVVMGARYHTGYDHKMYLDQYEHMVRTGSFSRTNFEWGFEWITRLFAACRAHYFWYFAFWGALQIGLLYYGLRRHKHLLCWVGAGIVLTSTILVWMNSLRQSVVVCLFVALVPLIMERKVWVCLLVVIVSSFIHKSALILLPLCLLGYVNFGKFNPRPGVLLGIFAAFVLLGLKPFWIDYFTNYEWFLRLTGYTNYANLDDPNVAGKFRILGWGPGRVTILLTNVVSILLYSKLRSHFKGDGLLDVFFMLAFAGMCLSNLLVNTSHFILRPVEYFTIFYLIVDAYMMVYLIETRKYIAALLLFGLAYSHIFIDVVKAIYHPIIENQPFLYHTFLLSGL